MPARQSSGVMRRLQRTRRPSSAAFPKGPITFAKSLTILALAAAMAAPALSGALENGDPAWPDNALGHARQET